MLCFDPAFFSFLMIDTNDFSFALGRWGSVFTQFIPLIALKNNCSLETFLRLYAISPIIIYFCVSIVIISLKNYRALIVLMLSISLGFRHAFYYTTAELYIGISFTVLLWAIIVPEKEYLTAFKRNIAILVCLLLIYIMSYLHQLTFFTILFVLVFELIINKKVENKNHIYILTVATIAWFTIRIFVFSNTEYESDKIPTLSVFLNQIPNLRYLPSTIYFKYFAIYQLWPLFLMLFIAWICLIKTRRWLAAVFLPLYSIAYLILILITYYKGESPIMYENYYTVFGVFAAVPFVFILQTYVEEKWRLIIILPFFVVSFYGIYNAHHVLTKRIDYIGRLVEFGRKQAGKKFLIHAENFPWLIGWVDWALPFETALFSALDGKDSVVTFFSTPEINAYDSLITKENVFLGPRWAISWFGSQNLNKKYFNFPSTGYEKLNTAQSDSLFDESIFNKANVQIQPAQKIYYADADSFLVVPVVIKNLLKNKIASIISGGNPVYLSYHIYDDQNNLIVFNGRKTTLDIDINKNYTQGLNLILPKNSGTYLIVVDFFTENKRWWGINSDFNLIVK